MRYGLLQLMFPWRGESVCLSFYRCACATIERIEVLFRVKTTGTQVPDFPHRFDAAFASCGHFLISYSFGTGKHSGKISPHFTLPKGIWTPSSTVCLGSQEFSMSINLFSRFCRAQACDRLTYRLTDRHTASHEFDAA